MKGMLVIAIFIGVVAIGAFIWWIVDASITRRAGVRRGGYDRARRELQEARDALAAIQGKVDEIGELNPILSNAIEPIIRNYQLKSWDVK